jgi:hypothetical protein
MQHIGKFRMNWLGPYVIHHLTETSVAQLETHNGEVPQRMG